MINKTFHIGNLCFDPELRHIASGTAVTSFRLGVQNSYKNSDGKYDSQFFDFEAWNKTAEYIAGNLKKGDKIIVEGELKNQQWDDKTTGEKRSKTFVQAQSVKILQSKNKTNSKPEKDGDGATSDLDQAISEARKAESEGSSKAPSAKKNGRNPLPDSPVV